MRRTVLPGVLLFTLACADKAPDGAKDSAATTPGTTPTATAAAPSIAPGSTIKGTLREQIAVGPYVYVRLETENGELWAAVNKEPLTVGAAVTVYNVMLMENFESPTLSRTFERIFFGALEPPGSAPQGQADATPGAMPNAETEQVGTPAAVDAKVGRIAKATGANAHTIGEIHAQQKGLAGATVSVRGVVVKYNEGVMGKNWIHIQDGTGTATAGTHDIAVTSLDRTAVGDTITITGRLRLDRDFGAGYVYPLVIEDSKLARK